jgi:hypothetical protein
MFARNLIKRNLLSIAMMLIATGLVCSRFDNSKLSSFVSGLTLGLGLVCLCSSQFRQRKIKE